MTSYGLGFRRRVADQSGFTVEHVTLTQVDDGLFHLERGFSYDALDGRRHTIRKATLNRKGTDLASVPGVLWWYVGSYGRHTRAALLHDFLVRTWEEKDRADADRIFREALERSGVPALRSGLMWTAVSLETTFRRIRTRPLAAVEAALLNAVLIVIAVGAASVRDPWWFWWSLVVVAVGVLLLSARHPGEALLVDQVVVTVATISYLVLGETPWWNPLARQWWEYALVGGALATWAVWGRRSYWMMFGILVVLPPAALNWIAVRLSGLAEYGVAGIKFILAWVPWKVGDLLKRPAPTRPVLEKPEGAFRPTRARPWLASRP